MHHRRGLKRVFRAGGMAAATYGVRVQGMSSSDLASLRSVASFVLFGKAKERPRAVQYRLTDPYDLGPSFVVNTLPLLVL
eukprot:7660533-Pyramimonas_sp.AAC.1